MYDILYLFSVRWSRTVACAETTISCVITAENPGCNRFRRAMASKPVCRHSRIWPEGRRRAERQWLEAEPALPEIYESSHKHWDAPSEIGRISHTSAGNQAWVVPFLLSAENLYKTCASSADHQPRTTAFPRRFCGQN